MRCPFPSLGELRFLWANDDEGDFRYLEPRLFEEALYVLDAEETNVSPIKQPPVLIREIVVGQSGHYGRMAHMRY